MLLWVIKTAMVSIILIALVDHLINFFKSTLTVPKIKDLVNTTNQSYENIYNTIQKSEATNVNNNTNSTSEYTLINLLPTSQHDSPISQHDSPVSMKDELKQFLKTQIQPEPSIPGLDPKLSNSFSSYSINN